METPVASEVENEVALDASVRDEDWSTIQHLWQSGFSNRGVYHLLRLRLAYRRAGDTGLGRHMDGFVPDARARFARWLVENGRLREDV